MRRSKRPLLSHRAKRHLDGDEAPDEAKSQEIGELARSALVRQELEPVLRNLGELMDITHTLLDRFGDPSQNVEETLTRAREWLASESDEATRTLYEMGRRASALAQASGNILCWQRPDLFDSDLFKS